MRKIINPQTPDKTILLPKVNIADGVIAFNRETGDDFAGMVIFKDKKFYIIDYFGITSLPFNSLQELIEFFNEFKFFEIGKQPQ